MQYYILHNGRYIRFLVIRHKIHQLLMIIHIRQKLQYFIVSCELKTSDKLVYENVLPFKKPTIHNAQIINETYLAFTLIYFIKKMRKMKSQNFVNHDMQKKSSLLGSKQYDAERDFQFLSWLYRDEKYSATSKLQPNDF